MATSEDRIRQLAEKIRRYRAEGLDRTLSERDTNALLVEKVLKIAGWPTDDPSQVSREDRPTERPVDYSLKIGGRPVVLVESKRLANKLTSRKHLEQALAYASSAGVRWSVLTNGCLFRIYNSLAAEVAENKLLQELDMAKVGQADGTSVERALQVIHLISPESVESGEIDEAWDQQYIGAKIRQTVADLWSEPDSDLVNLVRRRMVESGHKLTKKDTERWLNTLDVKVRSKPVTPGKPAKPRDRVSKTGPTKMRIGTYSAAVKYSNEVLVNTAEWLIQQGKLSAAECPIPLGRKRNLVSIEPKHGDEQDFRAPKRLSTGLWLEANLSGRDCIKHARRLLKTLGYPDEMLEVE
jgi:predicted type IV restriction endonuclease